MPFAASVSVSTEKLIKIAMAPMASHYMELGETLWH